MSDEITNAIQAVNNTRVNVTTNVLSSTSTTFDSQKERLEKLPLEVDVELLKRQAEAEVLSRQAQIEQTRLEVQENGVEMLKEKLINLALQQLPATPTLPVIDPKILQAVQTALLLKEVIKNRKQISRKNLSKGKELYSYPLRNITPKVQLPQIPTIPQLPLNL